MSGGLGVEPKTYVKIPMERIGVLIGPRGSVKRRLEERFGVKIRIDSDSGSVEISSASESTDPSNIYMVMNIVKAIGRGFSPGRAERLGEEDYGLVIIDLTDYVGRSKNALKRVRGRLIGRNGKAREMLEELTETFISVYGDTVAIIGQVDRLPVAREAVIMLIEGAFHSTVWKYLYDYRRRLRREKMLLWEGEEVD